MCVNSTPVTPDPITISVLGDLGRRVRLAGGEHALAVDGREVGHARAASRWRRRRSRPRSPRSPPSVVDDDRVRALEAAGARGSAARPATRAGCVIDLVQAALDRRAPARAARRRRAGPRPARPIVCARSSSTQLAAGGDHRLRRDAVPQVRGAADDVALDERDLGTERRRDASRTCCRRDRRR